MKNVLLILVGIFLIPFNSCKQEEIAILTEAPDEWQIEEVGFEGNDKLLGYISQITENTSSGRSESILGNLSLNDALLVKRDSIEKYTLYMYENDSLEFSNLIIEDRHGEVTFKIFKYLPDYDWLISNEENSEWQNFTGRFEVYDLDGNLTGQSTMKNGVSIKTEGGREEDLVCTTITWTVTVSTPYGSHTYYETETSCASTGGGFASTGGSSALPSYNPTGGGSSGGSSRTRYTPPKDCEIMFDEKCPEEPTDPVGFLPVLDNIKLCPDIKFDHIGEGFTAQATGLRMRVYNLSDGRTVTASIRLACITIPEYHASNRSQAAQYFAEVFDFAARTIQYEVQTGQLGYSSSAIRTKLVQKIQSEMQKFLPGSKFATGGCEGNVSSSEATYDC